MRFIAIFLFLIFLSSCSTSVKDNLFGAMSKGQDRGGDEFYSQINTPLIFDEEKKLLVKDIYKSCLSGDLSKIRALLDLSLVENKLNIGVAYWLIGNCYFTNGKLLETRHYYLKALSLLEDKVLVDYLHNNISVLYFINGYFGQGQLYLSKINSSDSDYAIFNIAIKNMIIGNYHLSLSSLKELMRKSKKNEHVTRLALYLNFLIGEYDSRFKSESDLVEKFYRENARYYFDRSIDDNSLSLFKDQKNYEKALFKQLKKKD